MKWIIKELAMLGSAFICAAIAMKLDSWNMIFLYWLIRIYAELVWRGEDES